VSAYLRFLAQKRIVAPSDGVDVDEDQVHPVLFGFQRDLTRWALRKGRAALFADTGLGKTPMQVEWARLTGRRTLILAPLAVAQQTIRQAAQLLEVEVGYARSQAEAAGPITITNYERLDRFDLGAFDAVVLDESSILKSFSGATKKALVAGFRSTPYRLCCTATPAPNDIEELCNHADFLSVMTPAEMRSTFFIADSKGEFMRYRLKGHARQAFYRWMASWAMAVKTPSDIGHDDAGYQLPELRVRTHFVETDWKPSGRLFPVGLDGIVERAEVRRSTIDERVAATVARVESEPDEAWLIWCGLNEEGRAVARAIPDAVLVEGSDPPERKAEALLGFADGDIRTLITKPSVAGFGMNWQRCARMVFLGLSDSFEAYYQAVRRCWRFGQTRPVYAHVVLSEAEKPIWDNVMFKERRAAEMAEGLVVAMRDHERAELLAGTTAADDYSPTRPLSVPGWLTTEAPCPTST